MLSVISILLRLPFILVNNNLLTTITFGLFQPMIKQITKQSQVLARCLNRYPDGLPDAESFKQVIRYRLPFEGVWYVGNGGIDQKNSHSWDLPEQRYAYDFLIMDKKKQTYKNLAISLNDFYCYSQAILAPADGIVVELKNNHRDYQLLFFLDLFPSDIRGNYIVIKHSDSEFSLLAHLRKGSICVKVGDHVKVGQKIAECGNSGNSTEPHLHFQIQDRQDMFSAMSLPVKFDNFYLVDDDKEEYMEQSYITKRQFVKNGLKT